MKIKVIDENERQQTESFIRGFYTGHDNTIANIIAAHDSGQSLKSIYKTIKQRKTMRDMEKKAETLTHEANNH